MVAAAFGGSAPVDVACRDYLRKHKQLGSRDKTFVLGVVYDLVRHRRWYEHVSGGAHPDPLELVVLRILDQGEFDADAIPADPGIVRRAAERLEAVGPRPEATDIATLALATSFPDWLVTSWVEQLGFDGACALAHAMNDRAPLALRANTLRATREQVISRLADEELTAEPGTLSPLGVIVKDGVSWGASGTFKDGWFEVQDEGSQLIALLCGVRAGQLVVDACAGGGGKTLALAAEMEGKGTLRAFDDDERRLSKLRPRARRADAHNIQEFVVGSGGDPRIKKLRRRVDCVLIDAPCSGLGTLRRSPDAWWRVDDAWLERMHSSQHTLLETYASVPKVGGHIVYATCSTLRSENEDQVEAFLARHAEYKLVSAADILAARGVHAEGVGDVMRLWPHVHGTDAFFGAVLERTE